MSMDHYELLGLTRSATKDEIKRAYRDLAKKYHPDRHQGTQEDEDYFKQITEAYNTLSVPEKKEQYDRRFDYLFYESDTYNSETEEVKNQYSPPPRNSGYRKTKWEYTPFTWMFGKIFIIALITTIILVPIGLFYYASLNHFEEGERLENKGAYLDASQQYMKSISRWGARNLIASIRVAELSFFMLSDYTQADNFYLRAMRYTEKDSLEAWLYYRSGQSRQRIGRDAEALNSYYKAMSLGYPKDSLFSQMAFIHGFRTDSLELAMQEFNYLLSRKADPLYLMGKGYCYHRMNKTDSALVLYDKSIALEKGNRQVHYFKGLAHFSNKDSISGCESLRIAAQLGHPDAFRVVNYFCTEEEILEEKP